MDNEEFIQKCYRKILNRSPDSIGLAYFSNALTCGDLSRESVLFHFLDSEEYLETQNGKEFVPHGHFYSGLPSDNEREAYHLKLIEPKHLRGIDLNLPFQKSLLESFLPYYEDMPFAEQKINNLRYYFDCHSYSYTDGFTLHSMIRRFKPSNIIEIGSGYSSCVTLDTNDLYFNSTINLTFVEPYPELLYSLQKDPNKGNLNVIEDKLQNIDIDLFKTLGENDVLFIDSTHVSKIDSDVNRLFFEILPNLSPGVLIHFHDIFWPFDYPESWVKSGRSWNEAYMLHSFLMFNNSYEIVFFSDYLHHCMSDWITNHMPLLKKGRGGNLWIRRKETS